MDLEDVEASSFLIKAVVGQRLIIPCSNSSLSELASTAKVVTAATRPVSSSTPMPGATRRQNQRFRQPLGRENGNQSSVGSQTRSPANGQGISLIVWHKDDKLNSPIFTADARGASSLREARQQAGSESLRGRAHLEESTKMDSRGFGSTPALVIEEASPEDVGVYTCTIEFHKAPTQTHQAHVELISKLTLLAKANLSILQQGNILSLKRALGCVLFTRTVCLPVLVFSRVYNNQNMQK